MLVKPSPALPLLHPDGLGARAAARCAAMARPPFSLEADALTRPYLTSAHRAALDALTEWLQAAGCAVRLDPAGTLLGRYEGAGEGAPALLIASHVDSVRNAGAYDGMLGVCLGVACVEALAAAGRRLPFAIEVAAFGDEEGSRFSAAMNASRAMAGQFDPAVLDIRDSDGRRLREALADFGLDPARYARARRREGEVFACIEPHIEQGPVLEAQGGAVGLVSAVAGQVRARVTLSGIAGHAGTTPMDLRRDALAGAAECVLAAERLARDAGRGVVATIGQIEARPSAANVIPGAAIFSLDVRAGEDARRDRAVNAIETAMRAIAERRGLALAIERAHTLPAAAMDARLTGLLWEACALTGVDPPTLASGAAHDAMILAALAPTAMLFIRCKGGVSHNPDEQVEADDCETALAVLLAFLAVLEREQAP